MLNVTVPGCIGSSERIAPATDRLVAQLNASIGHHQFDIPQAYGEIKVQPHTLGDNLFRKSVTAIRVGWHLTSITPARRDDAPEKELSPLFGKRYEISFSCEAAKSTCPAANTA